ncbi:hypothetical protein [Endozoicomonas atrinae]|uniref:hypothetical protein n=1 Tax=Endozoicomonas atrinae TaxID=1333660 RepID=UPI003B00D21F
MTMQYGFSQQSGPSQQITGSPCQQFGKDQQAPAQFGRWNINTKIIDTHLRPLDRAAMTQLATKMCERAVSTSGDFHAKDYKKELSDLGIQVESKKPTDVQGEKNRITLNLLLRLQTEANHREDGDRPLGEKFCKFLRNSDSVFAGGHEELFDQINQKWLAAQEHQSQMQQYPYPCVTPPAYPGMGYSQCPPPYQGEPQAHYTTVPNAPCNPAFISSEQPFPPMGMEQPEPQEVMKEPLPAEDIKGANPSSSPQPNKTHTPQQKDLSPPTHRPEIKQTAMSDHQLKQMFAQLEELELNDRQAPQEAPVHRPKPEFKTPAAYQEPRVVNTHSRLAELSHQSRCSDTVWGRSHELHVDSKTKLMLTFSSYDTNGKPLGNNDIGIKTITMTHPKTSDPVLDAEESTRIGFWSTDNVNTNHQGKVQHHTLQLAAEGATQFAPSLKMESKEFPSWHGHKPEQQLVFITTKIPGQPAKCELKELSGTVIIGSDATGSNVHIFDFLTQVPEIEARAQARGKSYYDRADNCIKILITPAWGYTKEQTQQPTLISRGISSGRVYSDCATPLRHGCNVADGGTVERDGEPLYKSDCVEQHDGELERPYNLTRGMATASETTIEEGSTDLRSTHLLLGKKFYIDIVSSQMADRAVDHA